MLVLTRSKDESITLVLPDGGRIEMTVVDIRGDKTRIGVKANPKIYVYRTELVEEEGMQARLDAIPDYRPGDNLDITV